MDLFRPVWVFVTALFIFGCTEPKQPNFGIDNDNGPSGKTVEIVLKLVEPLSAVENPATAIDLNTNEAQIIRLQIKGAKSGDLEGSRLVWCDIYQVSAGTGNTTKELCAGTFDPQYDHCHFSGDGSTGQVERFLEVKGSDLELQGIPELEHTIQMRLLLPGWENGFDDPNTPEVETPKDDTNLCTAPELSDQYNSLLVKFNVRQVYDAPQTEILPSPWGSEFCLSRHHPLRTRISPLPDVDGGTYTVNWYATEDGNQGEGVDSPILTGTLTHDEDEPFVCSGEESASSLCVLGVDNNGFVRGKRIYVTAKLVKDGNGQDVFGLETRFKDPNGAPDETEGKFICDAWPRCKTENIEFFVEPDGKQGDLHCSAFCYDPDPGDVIVGEFAFINTDNGYKSISVTKDFLNTSTTDPNFEIAGELSLASEDGKELGVQVGHDLRCEIYPRGTGLVQSDEISPYIPQEVDNPDGYYIDNRSDSWSVGNTPPEVSIPIILTDTAVPQVHSELTCEFNITDIDDEGIFDVCIRWSVSSGGVTSELKAGTGVYQPFESPTLDEAYKKLDLAEHAVSTGDTIQCQVYANNNDDGIPIKCPEVGSNEWVDSDGVVIQNTPPSIEPPGGGGNTTPGASVAAAETLPEDLDEICLALPPEPNTQLHYRWRNLECILSGEVIDPDISQPNYLVHRWYRCDAPDEILLEGSPATNLAIVPASIFEVGDHACCSIQACDCPTGNCDSTLNQCSDILAATDFGEQNDTIINTPPQIQSVEAVPEDPVQVDKASTFVCEAEFIDCDGDNVHDSYQWFSINEEGVETPIGNPGDAKAKNFGPVGLTCSDDIRCTVFVADDPDGDGLFAIDPVTGHADSEPFELANAPPTVSLQPVQAPEGDGLITPTSTIQCQWFNLIDANGDDISELRIDLIREDNTLILSEPYVVPNPNVDGEYDIELGTCGGAKDVQVGEKIRCALTPCDACGCAETAQTTLPGTAKTIVADPVQVLLVGNTTDADLISLSPPSVGKAGTFDCLLQSANQNKFQFCYGEPEDYQYLFSILDSDDTPINGLEDIVSATPNYSSSFGNCPANPTTDFPFRCQVDIQHAGTGEIVYSSAPSNTTELTITPPDGDVSISPVSGILVEDTLQCDVDITDEDDNVNDFAPTTYQWFKKDATGNVFQDIPGAVGPQHTLVVGTDAKLDQFECQATFGDGCFELETIVSQSVTVENSIPSYADNGGNSTVSMSPPGGVQSGEFVTCTADALDYSDADEDPLDSFLVIWQVSTNGGLSFSNVIVNETCSSTEVLGNTAVATMEVGACPTPIAKGDLIRCEIYPLDDSIAGDIGQAESFISINSVVVGDTLPALESVTLVHTDFEYSTEGPILETGEGTLFCEAQASDADGDAFAFEYVWTVNFAAGGSLDITSTENTVDINSFFGNNVLSPCDEIHCEARLIFNGQNIAAASTEDTPLVVQKGSSIRFTGQNARLIVNSPYSEGDAPTDLTPETGLIELRYMPETLPVGNQFHRLLRGTGLNNTGQETTWALGITNVGLRLRLNGVTQSLESGSDPLLLTVNDWNYLALQWDENTITLHQAMSGAPSTNTGTVFQDFPFDMTQMTIGSVSNAPDGWIDELAVRNSANASLSFAQPLLPKNNFTLALYHFNLHDIIIAADYGDFLFHALPPDDGPGPVASYFGEANECELGDIFEGTSGLTPATNVSMTFDGPTIPSALESNAPSVYNARCTADGAVDLSSGPVAQYEMRWYRDEPTGNVQVFPFGGTATVTPLGNPSAVAPLSFGEGCENVFCEATPLPNDPASNAIGPVKASNIEIACKSGEKALTDFNCEDNNPCTIDQPDGVAGCLHPFNAAGVCNNNCGDVIEGGFVAACVENTKECACVIACPAEPGDGPCDVWSPIAASNPSGYACNKGNANDGAACELPEDNLCLGADAVTQCIGGSCLVISGSDIECDDDNPCTENACDPESGCVFPANELFCDDGDACTANDQCSDEVCSGETITCDDINICTTDSCDENTGCDFAPNTLDCNDSDECTTFDACENEECIGGDAPICEDNEQCTDDSCNSNVPGGCVNAPLSGPCDDNNACTEDESCFGGTCVSPLPIDCDDTNDCTDDSCNPASGCVITNNTIPCTDGSACTTGDTCANGLCTPALILTDASCDDANACTTDFCDPNGVGCTNTPDAGAVCDDGDACTFDTLCTNTGTCVGTTVDCDDEQICTADTCDSTNGCQTAPAPGGCEDGNPCTLNDACAGGACSAGLPKDCEAGTGPCLTSLCELNSGDCGAPFPVQGSPGCTDGDACTVGDTCAGGACQGGAAPDCEDENGCTTDSCNSAFGCVNQFNTDNCDDGNACTENDTCNGLGACAGLPFANPCDDGESCTVDDCEPSVPGGCVFTAIVGGCDDGSACTTIDTCVGGVCSGTLPPECDDNNGCTFDACDENTGCTNTPQPGNICDADGNGCTVNDSCDAQGQCQVGGAPDCSGLNDPCNDGVCQAINAENFNCVASPKVGGTSCDADGNGCTENDACNGVGTCVSGTLADCSDLDDECLDGTCNSISANDFGCTAEITNEGAICNADDNGCTFNDTCAGGICVVGNSTDCTAFTDTCNLGVCSSTGPNNAECVQDTDAFENNPCNADGDGCTEDDTCQSGVCTAGPDANCSSLNDACNTGLCASTSPTSNTCIAESSLNEGFTCNFDDDGCTEIDTCVDGLCTEGDTPNCTAANTQCAIAQCVSTAFDEFSCQPTDTATLEGNGCNADSDGCTQGDVCAAGVCQVGATTPDCSSESDTCNVGFCSSTGINNFACEKDPTSLEGSGCDADSDGCTENDTCQSGSCLAGTTANCDGVADQCNTGTCQSIDSETFSCQPTAVADGTPCDQDSDACTLDSCTVGACSVGPTTTCEDGNICTDNSCNTLTGACDFPAVADGLACDDGNDCTVTDGCAAGQCEGDLTFCCDTTNPDLLECGGLSSVLLSPLSNEQTLDYTPAAGGAAACGVTLDGGVKNGCLADPGAAANTEICVDIVGVNQDFYLLEDTDITPDPNACGEAFSDGACVVLPATPSNVPNWVTAVHANSGNPDARIHLRCPVDKKCDEKEFIACEEAFACDSTSKWLDDTDSYGSCGTGKLGTEMVFKANFGGEAGTIWVRAVGPGGVDYTDALELFIAKPKNDGKCGPGQANNCILSGTSPLHVDGDTLTRCIWVELDPTVEANDLGGDPTQLTVIISRACY